MKLVSLYCNKPDIFPKINFREGFNVVFARVKTPFLPGHDSHNLGKTFLIEIIDFTLLGKVKDGHPFKTHPDLFDEFEFFLEVETNSKIFVTIKRKVSGIKGIFLFVSNNHNESLIDFPDDMWTYQKLGLDAGQKTLDDLLAIDIVKPYTYRKGLGYSLRSQSDYSDEFELERFHIGKDMDWKPFLSKLLGFDEGLIRKKYELDEQIKKLNEYQKRLEGEAGTKGAKYDELKGVIEARETEIERIRTELENFNFKELEIQINDQIVNVIETKISKLNEILYTLNYEIQEIQRSLRSDFEFNIDEIQQVFAEVKINLPDALIHDYNELLEFNRRLSLERKKRLAEIQTEKLSKREAVIRSLSSLNDERQAALSTLKEKQTLIKYKSLQKRVLQFEEEILRLKERLMYLDRAAGVKDEISEIQKELVEIENQLETLLRKENLTYREIRKTFTEYVEFVINIQTILAVSINQNGNYEFKARTIDRFISGRETNESEGTSYKKLLCACFDLALLSHYSASSFYRFVYHDGIFEGLDNRIKVRLLNLVREVSKTKGIQYILTVIDTDLPRDDKDQKLLFNEDEIIRELSDEGDQGRLFRMKAF
jgi:uncharacterized protein YydD (DUF2326 family)